MKVRTLSVTMLVALLGALALALVTPHRVSAAPKEKGKKHNPTKNIKAKGKFGDATINITRFSVNAAREVVAEGFVTHAKKGNIGTFSGAAVTVEQSYSAKQEGDGDECPILRLVIEPIFLDLLGLVVTTTRIEINITADPDGGLLGALLCGLANLLNPDDVAQALNRIVAALGGRLTSGSALFGLVGFDISSFYAQGDQLYARFFVQTSSGGAAGPFSTPVVVQQQEESCLLLRLELGPLHIDLLGLIIDIPEQIVIEIRAEPGPGNLLGNLLCALANLLNNDASAATVARQLNKVLKVLS